MRKIPLVGLWGRSRNRKRWCEGDGELFMSVEQILRVPLLDGINRGIVCQTVFENLVPTDEPLAIFLQHLFTTGHGIVLQTLFRKESPLFICIYALFY